LTVEEPNPERRKKRWTLFVPSAESFMKKGTIAENVAPSSWTECPLKKRTSNPRKKIGQKDGQRNGSGYWEKRRNWNPAWASWRRNGIGSPVMSSILYSSIIRIGWSPCHLSTKKLKRSLNRARKKNIRWNWIFLGKRVKAPSKRGLRNFQSLYKLERFTKPDFLREKKEIEKGNQIEREKFKKNQANPSLSCPLRGRDKRVSSRIGGNLFQPLGFGDRRCYPPSDVWRRILLLATARSVQYTPSQKKPFLTLPHHQLVTKSTRGPAMQRKIRALFENIRQANLQKNIDLFIPVILRDFSDREGKRLDALETWGFF